MKKRVLALGAAAVLALSLTACGSSQKTETTAAAADTTAAGSEAAADTTAASGEKTVIKLGVVGENNEQWQPVIKVSEQVYKRTIPGIQDLRRFYGSDGHQVADMICERDYPLDAPAHIVDVNDPLLTSELCGLECRPMLTPMVSDGEVVPGCCGDVRASRERARAALEALRPACKRFLNPQVYPVGIERSLAELRGRMIAEARRAQPSRTWR